MKMFQSGSNLNWDTDYTGSLIRTFPQYIRADTSDITLNQGKAVFIHSITQFIIQDALWCPLLASTLN
jgi:hypothetical protein